MAKEAKARLADSKPARAKAAGIGKGDHVYLVDGSGYIFRAFHALPPLTRKSDGLPTGALHGFCAMLNKLLRETKGGERPTHFAVIFDTAERSFRNDIYKDYKANRLPPPEDLVPQFPLMRDAVRAFNVPSIELAGYEADDLIATYAREAAAAGAKVTIVSSDKDLMQLVGPRIEMLDTMKGKFIHEAEVQERFGVLPEKVIEVQALAGDSTDNIPGVPGIGVKTAAELITSFGTLEKLLAHLDAIKQPKRRENLAAHAELAKLSRELVQLKTDAPVPVPLSECRVVEPDAKALIGFLRALEFNTLTRRVAEELGIEDVNAFAADEKLAAQRGARTVAKPKGEEAHVALPGAVPEGLTTPIERTTYPAVLTERALESLIERALDAGLIAVDTETTSLDPMQAELVGVSIALGTGDAHYIPLGHRKSGALDFGGDGGVRQLNRAKGIARLKPLLEHPGVLKIGQNIKYDMIVLKRCGVDIAPIDDTMLMSYVLDVGRHGHNLDELAKRHLGHAMLTYDEVTRVGRTQISFAEVPVERATEYGAEDADAALRLARLLKPRLIAERLMTVYETLERPLVPVLVEMEHAGIKVDRAVLARLSGDFAQRMAALEDEVHKLAGQSFNIGSPKQLGDILFTKMGLTPPKKTATGAPATDADVLETLAAQGHDLPARVLDWRQLAKLRSTYTEALPTYIHPETGRVHTSYSLAATSTGRLSSSEPNLQNIPIRTNEGREIRKAFVAEKGSVLMSADYSQIELRVLAHMACVPTLRQAFEEGHDIHAMTASEMFGVPEKGMDPMIRRRAKAINFGIIYGISAFGLANQLGIARGEAQAYIDTYFKRFPGIRDYMEETKARCRKDGHVRTLFGRRINFPHINSKNPAERGFVERAAINAPIQGTAADIIRRAMIRIPPTLAKHRLKTRMLLQVHDELVFEVPEKEVADVKTLVVDIMAKAPMPAVAFAVPIVVEAKSGPTWEAAH